MLFKQFGGVDAVPICLDTTDADEIVETVVAARAELRRHQPRGHLRAALLRDRAAAQGAARHPGLPRRPARHRRGGARGARRARCGSPAATRQTTRVVISGAGAAGVAVARILLAAGIRDLAVTDRRGVLHSARARPHAGQAGARRGHRRPDRPDRGSLADALVGRRRLHRRLRRHGARRRSSRTMADDAIIFGAGQPEPRGAPRRRPPARPRWWPPGGRTSPTRSTTCWRSPASSAGAFDVRATAITEGMKLAAATALADLVGDELARGLRHPVAVRPAGRPGRVAAAVAAAAARATASRVADPSGLDRVGACSPSTPQSFSTDDPLSGLVVGERPDPEAPDGWTTVTVKAASLNHHDLWSLRGVGLREEALPMILGCDAAGSRRGRQRGRRARRVVSDPTWTGDETLDPQRSLLSRAAPGHVRGRGRRAAPQRRAEAGVAVVRGGRLPADRVADGVPDALHPGRAQARRHGARAGRRRRRRDRADRARAAPAGCGSARRAATRTSAAGRWSSARTRCSRAARGCPARSTPSWRPSARATWSHSIRSLRPGGSIVISGATSGPKLDDAELTRIFFLQLRVIGSTMGTRDELAALVADARRHRRPAAHRPGAADGAGARRLRRDGRRRRVRQGRLHPVTGARVSRLPGRRARPGYRPSARRFSGTSAGRTHAAESPEGLRRSAAQVDASATTEQPGDPPLAGG